MTIKEYVRRRRLSLAALEIRDTKKSILRIAVNYGYNSQEAFSRAFCSVFSVMPGSYRKTNKPINLLLKIDLIKSLTHFNGMECDVDIDSNLRTYFIQKPSRTMIAKINPNPNDFHEFYTMCDKTGVFGTLSSIKENVFGPFGCWMNHPKPLHLVGIETEPDYSGAIPEGYEVLGIEESHYVVFHYEQHNSKLHYKVIRSVWDASEKWNPKQFGTEWNFSHAPIYEIDSDDMGYFVYKPIRKQKAS